MIHTYKMFFESQNEIIYFASVFSEITDGHPYELVEKRFFPKGDIQVLTEFRRRDWKFDLIDFKFANSVL